MPKGPDKNDGRGDPLDDKAMLHLVGYAVAQTDLKLLKAFHHSVGKPMNLRPVEFTLLTLLASNPRVTQKALATQLQVQAPNLTVILARLNKRDLLTTERNTSDGRSVWIGLSPAGKKLQSRAIEASRTMESQALSDLSRNERTTLLALLRRIKMP